MVVKALYSKSSLYHNVDMLHVRVLIYMLIHIHVHVYMHVYVHVLVHACVMYIVGGVSSCVSVSNLGSHL